MMYPFLVISDSFSSTSSIKREARELPDYLRYRIEQNQIFVQFRAGEGALSLRAHRHELFAVFAVDILRLSKRVQRIRRKNCIKNAEQAKAEILALFSEEPGDGYTWSEQDIWEQSRKIINRWNRM